MLPVFCQTVYWWKTSGHSVFDELPHYATASSCITCADVAVAPVVTLCTDDSSALLWGCTVVLSDPVCSAFEFWAVLCLWGALLSADCMCVYVSVWSSCTCSAWLWVYMILAHCVHSAAEVGFWAGFLWVFLLLPLNLGQFKICNLLSVFSLLFCLGFYLKTRLQPMCIIDGSFIQFFRQVEF